MFIGGLIKTILRRTGFSDMYELFDQLRSGSLDLSKFGLTGGNGRIAEVLGSDLLELGQQLIAAMKKTTGDGDPETGARFVYGHSAFGKSEESLRAAGPDDSWSGAGSRAYADQNTRQQLRAETMAGADLEVHRVLFREAAQISLRRGFLDDQANFLAYLSYATFPLQFIKTWGEAAKLATELHAVAVALGESTYHLYQLHSEVSANAAELQQAIGRYRGVADGAQKPGGYADFGPQPAPSSSAPRDDSIGPPVPAVTTAPAQSVPAVVVSAPPQAVDFGITAPDAAPSGIAAPPASLTPAAAPAPMAPLPPMPATSAAPTAASLGGWVAPLSALITTAAMSAAEQAAAAARKKRADDPNDRADGQGREANDDERAGDGVAAAGAPAERAPVEPTNVQADGPHTPETATLFSDTSSGPPAETSPQNS
jgi:hypothetical protein